MNLVSFAGETSMSLEELYGLIRERNRVSGEIARIIGRPALSSHIGEYAVSRARDF